MKRMRRSERTALMYATDLLSRRDYAETRLRQKLALREYSPDEIDEAIDKLKKNNYLNDQNLCVDQFELMYQSNKYSVRQICAKLVNLGFERQLVEECKPDDFEEHELIVAVKLLQSKFKNIPEDKKMRQFLASKGFEYSIIADAISEFKNLLSSDESALNPDDYE